MPQERHDHAARCAQDCGALTEAREQRARLQSAEDSHKGDKVEVVDEDGWGGRQACKEPYGALCAGAPHAEVLQARCANGFAGLKQACSGLDVQWNAEDHVKGVGEEVDGAGMRTAGLPKCTDALLDLGITQAGHRHLFCSPLRVEKRGKRLSVSQGYRHCNGGDRDIHVVRRPARATYFRRP